MGRIDDDGSNAVDAEEHVPVSTGNTEGLRIAAVFIILAAGLLGGVPPLFVKSLRNQESLPTFLIRAFSAGVILALALVHILPDAIEDLVNLGGVDYPLGGTSVLVGLFIMVFIEHGAHLMHDMPKHTHASSHGHDHQSGHGQGQGLGHGHSHARSQDRSHGGSHRSAGRGAGLSVGQPLLGDAAADLSEEGAVVDVALSGQGETVDGCKHPHAQAESEQTQQREQPQFQEQQQETTSGQVHEKQEQRQQQLEPDQQQGLQREGCKAAGTSHAAGSWSGAGPGCGGGIFARHSAGPALFPGPAGTLSEAPPRPLAACSLPLLAHCGRSGGGLVGGRGAPAGRAGDPSSTSSACAGPIDSAAGVATASALLSCPSDHCHDCVSRASAPNWASAVEASSETTVSLRLRIVAYLFELGCIFHSFIIGLSLGLNQTSVSQVRALLLALSFHQALEGLSLASVINGGGFSRVKGFVMVATYSVTCPLGVAIGIAIASSYDPASQRARAAQGCLNGISAGMLLYISLVQLVAEDMGKYLIEPPSAPEANGAEVDMLVDATATAGLGLPCGHGHKHAAAAKSGEEGRVGYRIRAPSFAAFCLGAASMCLLAVWA